MLSAADRSYCRCPAARGQSQPMAPGAQVDALKWREGLPSVPGRFSALASLEPPGPTQAFLT